MEDVVCGLFGRRKGKIGDTGKKKSMAFMSSLCKGQGTLRKRGQEVCKSQKTG